MNPRDRKPKKFPLLPISVDAYWERLYENKVELDQFWFSDRLADETLALLAGPSVAKGRALDIGCGVGNLTEQLARYFQGIVGIDFAESGIRRAIDATGTLDPAPEFVVGDATRLPFADDSFDYVFDRGCLQIIAIARWQDYFAGIERVLKAGGHYQLFIRFGGKKPGLRSALRAFRRRPTKFFARKESRSLPQLLDHLPPLLACETAEPVANPGQAASAVNHINIICRKSGPPR